MLAMRRQAQNWSIAKRRFRKMIKFLRVQVIHNYSRPRISLLIVTLVLLSLFFYNSSVAGSGSDSLALDSKASFLLSGQSPQDSVEEERKLSLQRICYRSSLENNVEELRFCGSFKSSNGPKLVGLVEVRNVESSIAPFLSALGEVVDSIVIIDDHSSDRSRIQILQHSTLHGEGKPLVEVMLNKTGEWAREELFDRELLLSTGRKIGGTHFILLDYDEYLSANCVQSGLLRETILRLRPGESVYLPWIELWKSHTLQRVLPDDPEMNFLKRRQTVIFADDGTSHYTQESATARVLGTHSRNNTIHVLRCPRTLCPKPTRYTGPGSRITSDNRVKVLSKCAILEMRFLNVNNVLLKSAWYEALGRVTGADEGATSGKMVNLLFPNADKSSEIARLESVDPGFLGKYASYGAQQLEKVEMWRAQELLEWMDFRGRSAFADLRSLSLIDVDELRNVLHQTNFDHSEDTYHVPHHKDGSFVVVYKSSITGLVRKLLAQIGFSEVDLKLMTKQYQKGVQLGSSEASNLQYENWKSVVRSTIRSALQTSSSRKAFLILPERSDSLCAAIVDVFHRDMGDANVFMLTTTSKVIIKERQVSKILRTVAQQRGSHVQLINVPIENFGSYSAMQWLTNRLRGDATVRNLTDADRLSILDFVEIVQQAELRGQSNFKFAPVGKLIFSLNFGRSGSKYLADVIGASRGLIFAQHEAPCPDARCSGGGALRMQNTSLANSYEERKSIKLPMIRQALAHLHTNETSFSESRTLSCDALYQFIDEEDGPRYDGQGRSKLRPVFEINSSGGCVVHSLRDAVYAETNPNFKSWIYDISLDFFPKVGYDVRVVVLRKYVAALLKSLYETGYFTLRDGYNWMETAAGVNSKVQAQSLQEDSKLDGYGKILSYLFNSEAVFRHVMHKYGHGKSATRFLEMRSERLYSAEGTMDLLDWLELEPSDKTFTLAGTVRDKYVEGVSKRRKTVSLAECDKHVNSFLGSIRDKDEAQVLRDLLQGLDKVEDYEYPP